VRDRNEGFPGQNEDKKLSSGGRLLHDNLDPLFLPLSHHFICSLERHGLVAEALLIDHSGEGNGIDGHWLLCGPGEVGGNLLQ